MNFEGDGTWSGKQVSYLYEEPYQNNLQYGNQTGTIDSEWNGSSYVSYRATRTWYYPNTSTAYLAGLPAASNSYKCPNGTCSFGSADLLSSHWYLYDGQITWNVVPSAGKLTGERQFIRWNGANYTDPRYADVLYTNDAWGNRTEVKTYPAEGTLTALAGNPAQTTTSTYDTTYHTYVINQVVGGLNLTTTWTYDVSLGLPKTETGPNGSGTTITAKYDTFGRLTKVIHPGDSDDSPTIEIAYYDSWRPFMVNVRQRTTDSSTYYSQRKFYDGLGRLIQVQTPGAEISDNDCSNCDIVVDTAFDAYDRPIKQTMPYAIPAWVSGGTPYHIQDFTKPKTVTSYDILGRKLTVTAPDGTYPERYTYIDLEVKFTDARNKLTRNLMDIWGRTTQVIPPTGPSVSYTYNQADQLTQVVRGGATTTLTYDALGRKLTLVDPDMGTWIYTYDGVGNLKSQKDNRGQPVCLYYDANNRLTNKYYAAINTTCPSAKPTTTNITYTYDTFDEASGQYGRGQRTGMADASGSTAWVYDIRGRLIKETKTITGSGTFLTQWGYNSGNQLIWMKYPGDNNGAAGEQVTFSYRPQNVVKSVTGTDTYVQSTTYDAAGRIIQLIRGAGTLTTNYAFYAWTDKVTVDNILTGQGGRLKNITTGTLQNLSYIYDAAGDVKSIVDTQNNESQTQTFLYDDLQRLTSASASGGTVGIYSSEIYGYDPVSGNMSSKAGLAYSYDLSKKHALRRVNGSGGSSKNIQIRAYSTICNDGLGANMELWVNGVKITTWNNVANSWTIYSTNAILSEKDQIDIVFTNDCNINGNDRNLNIDYVIVDSVTFQAEGTSTAIDKGSGSAAFDGQDMIPGQQSLNSNGALRFVKGAGAYAAGYDVNGNMTSKFVNGSAILMTYDTENHLTAVSGATSATFVYDGDGNRVKATVGSTTTAYLGNYFEYSGSTMKKTYYAGTTRVAVRVGSTISYLLTDHLGSTSNTINTSGTETGELRYKAWGETRYTSGSTPTSMRFTGQRQESTLGGTEGLYFYGSRWYDPALGRWAQPDTIIPNPYDSQSWDRYAYVNNNAVRYTDPTGHRVDDGCGTEGCELKTAEDYAAYSSATIESRYKSSLRHKGVAANSLVEKIYTGDNPVSRATLLAWATGNVAQGGSNVKLALTDLMLVSMSNLSTGLMAASMGGDVTPIGGVYSISNPNGVVVRVGHTNNFLRRAGQYRRDPNYFDLEFKREYYTDDYATQRGLEQMLYDKYQPPMNIYRPIRISNRNGPSYLQAASDFLNNLLGGD